MVLNLPTPIPDEEKKMTQIFNFTLILWCLKRFDEGPNGLRKTFLGTTKKCENKNLSLFLF